MLKKKKAQSTLEYAVLVVVIVAALVAIRIYMERGVQGKLRESTDQIGEQYSAGITTYKVATEQAGNLVTKESFGLVEPGSTTQKQGLSYYKVETPAQTTRKTEAAEKIETKVEDEALFE